MKCGKKIKKGTTQLWIHKKNIEPKRALKHLLQLDEVVDNNIFKSLLLHELTTFFLVLTINKFKDVTKIMIQKLYPKTFNIIIYMQNHYYHIRIYNIIE